MNRSPNMNPPLKILPVVEWKYCEYPSVSLLILCLTLEMILLSSQHVKGGHGPLPWLSFYDAPDLLYSIYEDCIRTTSQLEMPRRENSGRFDEDVIGKS